MSIDDYHKDVSAISHSGLDEVLEDPAIYYEKRIAKLYGDEDTASFAFGRRLHDALLQPGEFGAGVVTVPANVLGKGGIRAGAKYKAFAAKHAGRALVKPDEPLTRMIASAARSSVVRNLIANDGDYEHTIFWHDDEYDVERRCRCDFLHLDRETIVDIKSTKTGASPRENSQTIYNFGYHRQASFYCDGVEAMYGIRPRFIFIFMSTKPPYRVSTHLLNDEYLKLGKAENAAALRTYAECLKSGLWLPDGYDDVVTLAPPGYARFNNEWSYVTK